MLRSIAEIAREEGENLETPEGALAGTHADLDALFVCGGICVEKAWQDVLREPLHRLARRRTWAFWGPGFLGAFTTFSALALIAVEIVLSLVGR